MKVLFFDQMKFAVIAVLIIIAATLASESDVKYIKVFYYILPDWGESSSGDQTCLNKDIKCNWEYSGNIQQLTNSFNSHVSSFGRSHVNNITVAMYNIHSLWHKLKKKYPAHCSLKTNLSLACSEESIKHPSHSELFPRSFPNFDGYSTTSPSSSVQKIYKEAYLNQTIIDYNTANSFKPFSELIKAATYVASACHNKYGVESHRDKLVTSLRSLGFRIDGLGGCLKSTPPEGIALKITDDTEKNLIMKREVIGKYLFNMAFENTYDPGYVTEKPWDALYAGTVPVYYGDAAHLKALIPHPKAVIFVDDYGGDLEKLALYLHYLSSNGTAYEEHRNWRINFNSEYNIMNNSILRNSWYCRTCEWAVTTMSHMNKDTLIDAEKKKSIVHKKDKC